MLVCKSYCIYLQYVFVTGKMNIWSRWSRCGITCGNKWGKRYRSHTCSLESDEQQSHICSHVPYFHVQPDWCFGKALCPSESVRSSRDINNSASYLINLSLLIIKIYFVWGMDTLEYSRNLQFDVNLRII